MTRVMRAPGIVIPPRRGSTLVVTLIVLVVLTALGTAVGAIALNANEDANRLVHRRQAQVAAEYAVQAAMSTLDRSDNLTETLGQATKGSPENGPVDEACFAYYFQPYDETSSTVPVQVLGLSPGTPDCIDDDVSERGRFRMLASVKIAPELLNYGLGGNDLWLGTQP